MKKNLASIDAEDVALIDEGLLKSKIYTIRGVKVMLDADLAEIYGYSTKAFNQQVKNNIEKFDEDFRFQLNKFDLEQCSRSKILTLNGTSRGGNLKYNPYAFTEQGIYMLMTVLKGELTVQQSKALIRLFKKMKDYIVTENQQFLGNAEIASLSSQIAQNATEMASVSMRVDVLSGEVHDACERVGIMEFDLQKVMENFIDPTTYKHFLIFNGHKLEADVAYTQIYGMAKKSMIVTFYWITENSVKSSSIAVPRRRTLAAKSRPSCKWKTRKCTMR